METISISRLKAHLSSEIKKVRQGASIIVMDHNHPVAQIIPIKHDREPLEIIEAAGKFKYESLEPLVKGNIMEILEEERSERW